MQDGNKVLISRKHAVYVMHFKPIQLFLIKFQTWSMEIILLLQIYHCNMSPLFIFHCIPSIFGLISTPCFQLIPLYYDIMI